MKKENLNDFKKKSEKEMKEVYIKSMLKEKNLGKNKSKA